MMYILIIYTYFYTNIDFVYIHYRLKKNNTIMIITTCCVLKIKQKIPVLLLYKTT